ncbi:SDR family oxidoreductase [Cupriavidus sp. CP313]
MLSFDLVQVHFSHASIINEWGAISKTRWTSAPMNRFGKPDEIAAAIEFLLSEDAAFITGQTLFVDGGASVGRSLV